MKKTIYLSVIILSFVLQYGCVKNNQEIQDNETLHLLDQLTHKPSGLVPDKPAEEVKKEIPQIQGRYDMILGFGRSTDDRKHDYDIFKSTFYFEKLNETDFGYYGVTKRKELSPNFEYNFVAYDKNKFYQRGLENNGTPYLYQNEELWLHGDTIALIQYHANMTTYMIFEKKPESEEVYVSLRKTMKEAKQWYEKKKTNIVAGLETHVGKTPTIYNPNDRYTEYDQEFKAIWDKMIEGKK